MFYKDDAICLGKILLYLPVKILNLLFQFLLFEFVKGIMSIIIVLVNITGFFMILDHIEWKFLYILIEFCVFVAIGWVELFLYEILMEKLVDITERGADKFAAEVLKFRNPYYYYSKYGHKEPKKNRNPRRSDEARRTIEYFIKKDKKWKTIKFVKEWKD